MARLKWALRALYAGRLYADVMAETERWLREYRASQVRWESARAVREAARKRTLALLINRG
jgi:hypothetical protein